MSTLGEEARAEDASGSVPALLSRSLEWLCHVLVGGILAALLAVVLAEVGARYLFGASLLFSQELALWLFAALVALGLPLVSAPSRAVRLDLMTGVTRRYGKAALEVFAEAVTAHAVVVLLLGAWQAFGAIGGRSVTLGVSEAWRFAPIIIGAGLALAHQGLRALRTRSATVGLGLACGGLLALLPALGVFAPIGQPSLVAGGVAAGAILLGAPVPHALISGAAIAVPFGAMLPGAALVQNAVASIGGFLLLAIPFFLLAGSLMTLGGLAERLVRLASSLVGHRRAGLAQTTLATNLMISGLSGSSIADAAFGAKVLAPPLVKAGYPHERAAAIVAATSILPNIVPPSIAFLILAFAANLSVGALFFGGLLAGVVVAASLALALHFLSREAPGERASWAVRSSAFLDALPALGLVLVILVGIRFGVVTTTEAAALAALYALAITLLRAPSRRRLPAAFAEAGREAASVGLLIAAAAPFAFLLAVDGLGTTVANAFSGFDSAALFLLAANLFLLAAGTFLDIGVGILLLAPLLLPAATAVGIDPIHFGVILVVNLMIGGLTPPLGILVFVAARVSGVSSAAVFRSVLPLMGALLAALFLISLFAALAAT